jgi:hypothetical protein
MADDPGQILQTSDDPDELVVAAVELARSRDAAAHRVLGTSLQSASFLQRLDSSQDYAQTRDQLRVAAVLRALSENREPSARELLVALTKSTTFIEAPSRVELLIEASVDFRPPAQEVIRFWEKHFGPDDVYKHLIIKTLVENGSKPALELYEKTMAGSVYSDGQKTAWLRQTVPPYRDRAALLDTCDRMLRGGLPESLRPVLVEALFDFQPQEWFRPSTEVSCAPLERFGAMARQRMRAIGEYALKNVSLPERTRQAVADTLEQLERRPKGKTGAGA